MAPDVGRAVEMSVSLVVYTRTPGNDYGLSLNAAPPVIAGDMAVFEAVRDAVSGDGLTSSAGRTIIFCRFGCIYGIAGVPAGQSRYSDVLGRPNRAFVGIYFQNTVDAIAFDDGFLWRCYEYVADSIWDDPCNVPSPCADWRADIEVGGFEPYPWFTAVFEDCHSKVPVSGSRIYIESLAETRRGRFVDLRPIDYDAGGFILG